jgi:hypothetical protein
MVLVTHEPAMGLAVIAPNGAGRFYPHLDMWGRVSASTGAGRSSHGLASLAS